MSENAKKVGLFGKIIKYFKEVKGEAKKVIWPTWAQTVNNTAIVIAVIVIVAVFLGIVDVIFGGLVRGSILGDISKAFKDMFGIGM